jgi:hypothetical protein
MAYHLIENSQNYLLFLIKFNYLIKLPHHLIYSFFILINETLSIMIIFYLY